MFAEKTMQSSSITGLGSYQLSGSVGAFKTWRSQKADGSDVFYFAETGDGTIWEAGYGTLAYGTPDTISRNLITSSTGSLIDWVAGDAPIYVMSVPVATALNALMTGGLAAALPAWAQIGWGRLDNTDATVLIKKRQIADAVESVEGRHYVSQAIFAASQRTKFDDKGAANYTFTAADVGKTLCFDTTAAARTLTLIANNATGMGEGAYFYVQPYGSASNGVTVTPAGAETMDLGVAPPGRRTLFMWDGAKSKWRSDYVAPSVVSTTYPAGTITGLTYANNVTDPTNDIDVAAGACMDATGAYWMVVSALTKRLDAAWAVGTNQGGLDTGSIGDSDYYIWAIARSDTGVKDILFSLSSTAPTMPANYDYKRLIGWFKREAAAITPFATYELGGGGLKFQWASPTLDISLSNTLTTSRRLDAVKVPVNFSVEAHVTASVDDASAAFLARVCSPAEANGAPSATAVPLANINRGSGATSAQADLRIRTDSSGRIAARATLATVDTYAVMTLGFEWARR